MRKSWVAALVLIALGAAACSSSSKTSSTGSASTTTANSTTSTPANGANATVAAKKTAFCAANESIDKASANIDSASGFLAVLKSHQAQLQALVANAPAGAVGQDTTAIVNAAHQALTSNNANALDNPALDSGAIDTYCAVDGNGDPLPAYFATGKGTTFCKGFLPIFRAVGNANGPADTLKVLVSNKTEIAQLAAEARSLPSSIRSTAITTVTNARTAIAQNSAASLKQGGNGPAQHLALYCGQNQ
jgi:hypothetical protein